MAVLVTVWVIGVLVLFFFAGAYRSYTKTEWGDMDGPFILVWPLSLVVALVAGICHAVISAGAWIGIWARNDA